MIIYHVLKERIVEDVVNIILQFGIRQIQQSAQAIIAGSADADAVIVVDVDVVVEAILVYLDVPLLTTSTYGWLYFLS